MTTSNKTPLSLAVIILTFNEEKNITAALDSVQDMAQEIYVVDSYSTDKTIDTILARKANNIHIVQHRFENYSKQWNWALTQLPIKADWTVKLDADERATPSFLQEVAQKTVSAPKDLHAFYFKRAFFFMDTPLQYGGFSGNLVMHLWRTGKATFENRSVNEHALVTGQTSKLSAGIEHHDFKSLTDWLAKHNRYSSMEATNALGGNLTGDVKPNLWGNPDEKRMWLRKMYRQVPGRPFLYFLYRYLFRLGFLDGLPGFRYCFLHASYRYWTELKICESQKRNIPPEVEWPKRGKPHPIIMASQLQKQVNTKN